MGEVSSFFRQMAESIREMSCTEDGGWKRTLYASLQLRRGLAESRQSPPREPALWIDTVHPDRIGRR